MKNRYRDYTRKTMFRMEPVRFNLEELFLSVIGSLIGIAFLFWIFWR